MIGSLLFTGVWLLGWTLGVSVLQVIIAQADAPIMLLLFGATHGGSEVLVLRAFAKELQDSLGPPANLQTSQTHAGVEATWDVATPSSFAAFYTILVGLVTHVALFGSLYFGFVSSSMGPWNWLVAAAFSSMWLYTGAGIVQAVNAYWKARATGALHADFDRVTVSTSDTEPVHLPMLGLTLDALDPHTVELRSGSASWSGRLPLDDEGTRLLELLRTMASRATQPETVPVPGSLQQLRRDQT